ncbi:MAG TPA: hypothetical protein VNK89_13860 [Thermoflexus sp.]|nr:hypothetical protein [Thermoflexus sp.]
MSEPIVFISRNKIKDGKIEAFRKHYQDSIQPIFDSKPSTLAQLGYELVMKMKKAQSLPLFAFSRMRTLSISKFKVPMNDQRRHTNISSRSRLRFSEHPILQLWRG